jgi:NodT family efflux transporter outer membrane factor (OMF) lipoprotein
VPKRDQPPLELPKQFSEDTFEVKTKPAPPAPWWQVFESPQLNELEQEALVKNWNLIAAASRLAQAEARAQRAGAPTYPELALNSQTQRFQARNRFTITGEGPGSSPRSSTVYQNDFILSSPLTWELDLWQRIRSAARGEEYRALASAADLDATRLLLSAQVARAWLGTIRSNALLTVLHNQQKTSDNLVKLTEARYTIGKGTALDVFQQRQQRISLASEEPLLVFENTQHKNQLALLRGKALTIRVDTPTSIPIPKRIPSIPAPKTLLRSHPTVLRALFQLQAADQDVASAVAERLPRIQLSAAIDFRASDVSDLIDQSLASIATSFGLPLFDGGRRRAVVAERKARVDELLASLSSAYLETYTEIQDSISLLTQRALLVEAISRQLEQATLTLKESELRYLNGASEYLQVVTALQAHQLLERRLISEQSALAEAHIRYAAAIGGSTLSVTSIEPKKSCKDCKPPATQP